MKTVWVMMIAAGMAAAGQVTWAGEEEAGRPQSPGRRPPPGEAGARFKEMDKDSDGKVTWDEFRAFHEAKLRERFDAMDSNNDGVVSRDDFKDRPHRPGRSPRAKPETPATTP